MCQQVDPLIPQKRYRILLGFSFGPGLIAVLLDTPSCCKLVPFSLSSFNAAFSASRSSISCLRSSISSRPAAAPAQRCESACASGGLARFNGVEACPFSPDRGRLLPFVCGGGTVVEPSSRSRILIFVKSSRTRTAKIEFEASAPVASAAVVVVEAIVTGVASTMYPPQPIAIVCGTPVCSRCFSRSEVFEAADGGGAIAAEGSIGEARVESGENVGDGPESVAVASGVGGQRRRKRSRRARAITVGMTLTFVSWLDCDYFTDARTLHVVFTTLELLDPAGVEFRCRRYCRVALILHTEPAPRVQMPPIQKTGEVDARHGTSMRRESERHHGAMHVNCDEVREISERLGSS